MIIRDPGALAAIGYASASRNALEYTANATIDRPQNNMNDIEWDMGAWTHEPAAIELNDGLLGVTAKEGSDAWMTTSYGFIHDSEHALLAALPPDSAMEVEFHADFSRQFDQAGIFVSVSATHWIKAGVEFVDGALQLGAVVTNRRSDWSIAPVTGWNNCAILIRVSRTGDALIVRANVASEPLQLVRVVPLDPALALKAGPFVCAPTRAGFNVTFSSWRLAEPDVCLH